MLSDTLPTGGTHPLAQFSVPEQRRLELWDDVVYHEQRVKNFRNASIGLLTVGGITALAAIVLFAVSSKQNRKSKKESVSLLVSPLLGMELTMKF